MPLRTWILLHKNHGRAGPWQDAKVHVNFTWCCPCGDKYQWTEEEAKKFPLMYSLT